jgi:proteasome lid subunit RPN8/RPN11
VASIKFGEIQEMALPKERPPQTSLNSKDHSHNGQGFFSLYILKSEIKTIQEHLDEIPEIESGGLLFGHPFTDINNPEKNFTVVVGSARVKSVNSGIGHYMVSPEELFRTRTRLPEGLMTVGWYHSHPGHGVFLSGADMLIMESVYSLNWQLAYVFDTFSRQEGFFNGEKGNKVNNINYLREKPKIIEAVSRYNCAIAAQEDANDSVLESFKNWIYKNPMGEMSHWIEKRRYQNIQLDSIKLSSASDSEWQKEFNKAVSYYNSGKILTAKLVFEYLLENKKDQAVIDYLQKINRQRSSDF